MDWGSFLLNPRCGGWWNEWMVPRWLWRETLVGWLVEYVLRTSTLCPMLTMPVRLAAMSDFAKKQDDWYSTWPQGDDIDDRALIV